MSASWRSSWVLAHASEGAQLARPDDAVGPPAHCSDVWHRWTHNDCYCPIGLFWPASTSEIEGQAPLWTGLMQLRRLWSDDLLGAVVRWWDDGDIGGPWCTRRALDIWGILYPVYAGCTGLGFLALAAWSAIRLFKGMKTAFGADRSLQVAIHTFCFLAALFRLEYLVDEAILVRSAGRQDPTFLLRAAGASYTIFFPLSAAAFLCICQYWLRLISFLDQTDAATEDRPWYRNPLIIACLVFLGLETVHDIWYLLGSHPFLEVIYFFWLSIVSVMAALLGVSIARRLYKRLRVWITDSADAGVVFRKTLVSAALVSASSVSMLLLSTVQALFGRFYPWPCLACFFLGRFLEIAYLTLVLSAVGRSQASRVSIVSTGNSMNPGLDGSFAESSFSSERSPTLLEAFWISEPPGPGGSAQHRGSANTSG
eukprot:TRINITY_DN40532_c0_g1_i1.p1 TRINITY_DN40532_c0_g1~~TRINITY_DN40532_c0_g1_i1.p1  ORF type:complete len:439 (-),score=51.22 TRINITY_DN40532_c0_g1_i1:60-1337(-)